MPIDGNRSRRGVSVADAVVSEIEQEISGEGYAAGFRIGTKKSLAERFGIAPATLQEALRVLSGRGVIEARPGPGGGVFVTSRSPLIRLANSVLELRAQGASVNDVVGVLDALDEAVIRDAASARTDEDVADLEDLLAELTQTWHDPVRGLHCNWRLHRRIALISPNPVLRAFYLHLVDYIEEETLTNSDEDGLIVAGFRPDSRERLEIHADLVRAIGNRDEALLSSIIQRHRTSPQ